ncbi:MAG: hypothetical protein K940chlam4_00236 [Candidatus Anoxychlamydiales bacterium]|nr:hypothetical protein [Candidatus Anoxychlamydiales bacterium]
MSATSPVPAYGSPTAKPAPLHSDRLSKHGDQPFTKTEKDRIKAIVLIALTVGLTAFGVAGGVTSLFHFVSVGGALNLTLGVTSSLGSTMGSYLLLKRAKDWYKTGNVTKWDKALLAALIGGGTFGFGSVLISTLTSVKISSTAAIFLGSISGPALIGLGSKPASWIKSLGSRLWRKYISDENNAAADPSAYAPAPRVESVPVETASFIPADLAAAPAAPAAPAEPASPRSGSRARMADITDPADDE